MRVARLKETYPSAKVKLWCEDEHRLGLKPIIRKVWSPIGQRPLVKVHQRYEWTYLYALARPKSGEVCWLMLPTVNAEVFSLALEHFAREPGKWERETEKRILLVLDQAGWHTGLAHRQEEAKGARRDTPGVPTVALTGAPTLREAVAAFQRRGCKPPLRGDRGAGGAGGGARGALRSSVRPAQSHPLLHPLPLVAQCCVRSRSIQTDLVSFRESV